MNVYYYLLFDNHEQAVALHRQMMDAGIRTSVAPAPRAESVCCGVALIIREADYPSVQAYLDAHPEAVYQRLIRFEQSLDSHHDHYI